MGYTITEKLLMKACKKTEIKTGELIKVNLDMVRHHHPRRHSGA